MVKVNSSFIKVKCNVGQLQLERDMGRDLVLDNAVTVQRRDKSDVSHIIYVRSGLMDLGLYTSHKE